MVAFSVRSLRAWFRVAVVAGSNGFSGWNLQDCFIRDINAGSNRQVWGLNREY